MEVEDTWSAAVCVCVCMVDVWEVVSVLLESDHKNVIWCPSALLKDYMTST